MLIIYKVYIKQIPPSHTHTHTYTHTFTHAHTHARIHTHTRIHSHTNTYIHTYIHTLCTTKSNTRLSLNRQFTQHSITPCNNDVFISFLYLSPLFSAFQRLFSVVYPDFTQTPYSNVYLVLTFCLLGKPHNLSFFSLVISFPSPTIPFVNFLVFRSI